MSPTPGDAPPLIFVVDDHRASAEALTELLEDAGYRVRGFEGPQPVIGALQDEPVSAVVTDLRMDGMDGIELLRECRRLDPSLPVILVTAHATIARAVEATQAGAFAFLTKPLNLPQLLAEVRNAVALHTLSTATTADRVVGRSPVLLQALARADRAAASDLPVLVTGETGTGKELLARRVHRGSTRAKGPFVAVNCGAIPDTLIEGELFGAARGAYTGADRDRPGIIESAHGGTLFLDEVGELTPSAQVRLLRFLQEGQIRRLGETRDRTVDVRVVAATHRDLRGNGFRQDLYYRLAVIPVDLPPLRARGDDVLLIFGASLRAACARVQRPVPQLTGPALEAIRGWSWPGNIRELINLAERIAVLSVGDVVEVADLPPELLDVARTPDRVEMPEGDFDLTGWLEGIEERALRRALTRHDGVKAQAATSLGLERTAFRYKLKKYGIEE
jgi:DNA-binding NtrC family response regulator